MRSRVLTFSLRFPFLQPATMSSDAAATTSPTPEAQATSPAPSTEAAPAPASNSGETKEETKSESTPAPASSSNKEKDNAGPSPSTSLYVGELDPSVTEAMLYESEFYFSFDSRPRISLTSLSLPQSSR